MVERRFRDRLVGRREFRALVEVEHGRAVDHGGRPIPGTPFAEFTLVGTGEKRTALGAALRGFRDRLAIELPDATVRAVLERAETREPEPRLIGRGRRPLLLAGEEEEAELERQLDRVVAAWQLPADRYRLDAPLGDHEWWMRVLSCVAGVVLGSSLTIQLLLRTMPVGPDATLWSRLWEGHDHWSVAAIVLATLPLAALARPALLPLWPVRGRWIAAGFAFGPAVLIVGGAAAADGFEWLVEHHPVPVSIMIGLVGIGAAPVLALTVEGRVWRAGIGWGLPLLAGGISVFAGDMMYALYLDQFGLSRSDVSTTYFHQWVIGAFVTSLLLLGVYPGVAFWAVGRRFIGASWVGTVMTCFVTIIYLLSVALFVLVYLQDRAEIAENGLPAGLTGLEPRLACVVPVAEPYSYVGQPVERTSEPVVYFGRADGRLAVWSARSGGVLLDGQAVGLRFVQPGSTCG